MTARSPTLIVRSIAVVVVGLSGLLFIGCAASGPRMSGLPLGNTRVVSVGEIVELRSPAYPDGQRRWRLSSFDSLHLALAEPPRTVRTSGGTWETVVRVEARTAGETDVELTEIVPVGANAATTRFRVRILE